MKRIEKYLFMTNLANIDGETAESDGAKGYYVLDKSQLKSPDKQFIDME